MKVFRKVSSLYSQSAKRPRPAGTLKAIPVPPGPSFLLEHRDIIDQYYPQRNPTDDNPLAAIYRMYAAILGGKDLWLRTELEAFFKHDTWTVSQIPDPRDPDSDRYKLVALVTYILAASLNKLIELGLPRNAPAIITDDIEAELKAEEKKLEYVPLWAKQMPSFNQPFSIPNGEGKTPLSVADESADPIMLTKNVLTESLPIYFI